VEVFLAFFKKSTGEWNVPLIIIVVLLIIILGNALTGDDGPPGEIEIGIGPLKFRSDEKFIDRTREDYGPSFLDWLKKQNDAD